MVSRQYQPPQGRLSGGQTFHISGTEPCSCLGIKVPFTQATEVWGRASVLYLQLISSELTKHLLCASHWGSCSEHISLSRRLCSFLLSRNTHRKAGATGVRREGRRCSSEGLSGKMGLDARDLKVAWPLGDQQGQGYLGSS